MSSLVEGLGTSPLWGFTPAIDLQDSTDARHVNILTVGAGDVRHILKTISRSRRHGILSVNIYVHEQTVEALARDLLFLTIAMEHDKSIESRSQTMLEIFGNIFIREKTQETLVALSGELKRLLVHEQGVMAQLVDLSHVKYKERDAIEHVVTSWSGKEDPQMDKIWDQRLRRYFGDRYDARFNLIDWDYHMRGIRENAFIIHEAHYKRWRMTGLAFELRECEYKAPNRTLLSTRAAVDRQRGHVLVRGYWSDIVVTPHVAFGVEADDSALFEVRNRQCVKTSIHVAEYNIAAYLTEWLTGSRYVRIKTAAGGLPHDAEECRDPEEMEHQRDTSSDDRSARKSASDLVKELTLQSLDDLSRNSASSPAAAPSAADDCCAGEPEAVVLSEAVDVKIIPLTGDLDALLSKQRYQSLFHRVHIGLSQLAALTKALASSCRRDGMISVDTARYLPLTEEQKAAFATKINDLATAASLAPREHTFSKQANTLSFAVAGER